MSLRGYLVVRSVRRADKTCWYHRESREWRYREAMDLVSRQYSCGCQASR